MNKNKQYLMKNLRQFETYRHEPKVLKWESLKSDVKRQIKKKIRNGSDVLHTGVGELLVFFLMKHIKGKSFNVSDKHKMIAEITDDLCNIVDNWDIRNAGALFELYPAGIPTFIRDNNYDTELDDDGWVLIEQI